MRREVGSLLGGIALLASASISRAQESGAEGRLQRAKDLFRQGVDLLVSDQPERALEFFLRSRELVPAAKNTIDAGICLERLGRHDEALELYEDVSARFRHELDEPDSRSLDLVISDLELRVGRLAIWANVTTKLVVDGKTRGTLPRSTPLPVLPGLRTVTLTSSEHRPFERVVRIEAGTTTTVSARLEPLRSPALVGPSDSEPPTAPPTVKQSTPSAPRTERRARMLLEIGLRGGFLFSGGLHGDPEATCPELCSGDPYGVGGQLAVVLGLRERSGFGLEIGMGVLGLRESFARALVEPTTGVATHVIEQDITAAGTTLTLHGTFATPVRGPVELTGGLGGGVFFANYLSRIHGVAAGNEELIPLHPDEARKNEATLLLRATAGVASQLGRTRFFAGAGLWLLPMSGPSAGGPELSPEGCTQPGSCPPVSYALESEQLRGPGFWATPEVGIGYVF